MAEIVIPTKQLSVLDESMDLQDALKAFVYSEDDVLPVLDKTHQIFRGNIYLLDLYKHLAKDPNSTTSITQFIKNTNKYITKKDCLLQTLFQFGNLPYLAVLNEQHHFIGILRHHSFMKLLEKIWSFDHAKYVLTIDYENVDRAMYQLSKVIHRPCEVLGCMSLTNASPIGHQQLLLLLGQKTTEKNLNECIRKLEKRHFKIDHLSTLP